MDQARVLHQQGSMSAFPQRALQPDRSQIDPPAPPPRENLPAQSARRGAVVRTESEKEYAAVFGAFGIVQQAKDGFIASRFSPNQPLRMKRLSNARREPPMPYAEVACVFCCAASFENSLAA